MNSYSGGPASSRAMFFNVFIFVQTSKFSNPNRIPTYQQCSTQPQPTHSMNQKLICNNKNKQLHEFLERLTV